MNPQSWEQFGIWLAMQFPVLAAAVLVTRYFLRLVKRRADDERGRIDAMSQRLLAEREARIAERDQRIGELKDEVAELRTKLSRSGKKLPNEASEKAP